MRRAWKRWGWRGVSAALARETEVHKLLTSERILGLDLIRGRKAGGEVVGQVEKGTVDASETVGDREPGQHEQGEEKEGEGADQEKEGEGADEGKEGSGADEDDGASEGPETAGLPLFGGEAGPSEEDN